MCVCTHVEEFDIDSPQLLRCKSSNSQVCCSRLFYSAVRSLVQLFVVSHTVFYCSPLFWRSAFIDRNSTVTLLMFFKPRFLHFHCVLFKETVVFLKPLICTLNGWFSAGFTAKDCSFYWTMSEINILVYSRWKSHLTSGMWCISEQNMIFNEKKNIKANE